MIVASLILTSPLMLLGALAVALPVVAHLLNRRARQRVVFPTLMLLRQAAAGPARLLRLRRWVLLALRCLAILAVAAAFARPVWSDAASAGGGGGSGAAVVIVADVSASSAQRVGGVSLIHALRAAAMRLLDELNPGADVANLIYAGANPRAAFPNPVANLAALRQDLTRLEPTQERADLSAALAAAAQMLAQRAGQRRIIILSDMQATNWADVQLPPLPPGVRLTVLPVGDARAVNTAIAQPQVMPARPIAGRPARFTATLLNSADRAREVDLTLQVDGQTAGAKRELLGPFEQREVAIDAPLPTPGPHAVTLATGGDDLDTDDRRPLVVEAVARVSVAVITDNTDPTGSGFYLARALAPTGTADDEIEAHVIGGADIAAQSLRGYDAVILGDVAGLSPAAMQELSNYTAGGGGLAVFLGAPETARAVVALDAAAPAQTGALLPMLPTTRRDLAVENRAAHITDGAWNDPLLAPFDEAARDALAQIPAYRPYATSPLRTGAGALLTFTDATPALATHAYGSGRVIVANFSPAPDSSDMGKHGVFVALLHRIVDVLRPRGEAAVGTVVGRSLSLPLDAAIDPASLTATGPDGKTRQVDVARESGVARAELSPVDMAGFYSLDAGGRVVATAAAHIDEREGDVRRIRAEEVARRLGGAGEAANVEVRAGESEQPLELSGRSLWPALVMAAMAAMGLELLVLAAWKR